MDDRGGLSLPSMSKFEVPVSIEVRYSDASGGIQITFTKEIEADSLEAARQSVAFMLGSLGVLFANRKGNFLVENDAEDTLHRPSNN